MKFLSIIILPFLIFIFGKTSCKIAEKMKGVCLVSPSQVIGYQDMAVVKRIHPSWIAIIPYGFSKSGSSQIHFDSESQWWGESTEGTKVLIQLAQANNFKIMLKPHVWIMGQGWAGDFNLKEEENWKIWEQSYQRYILKFVEIAENMDVDLFCLGTEFRIPARERPEFWKKLAKKIRKIYSGKLTYASNWDNYKNITWWQEMDYIGIDAYFPLAQKQNPSLSNIMNGWKKYKKELQSFAFQYDKPILFTEYGFQSVNGAVGEHWKVDKSNKNANQQLQADAYEATFQTFMNEDWFAGGFLWKWHFLSNKSQHINQLATSWTPQHKSAEKIIATWYRKKITFILLNFDSL